MDELPLELNIVTLNCWGLPFISPCHAERAEAIGQYLAGCEPVPHIVALQECWTSKDYRSIRRETRFTLPFGKFYHSGAFGSGLAILSRWPIEESTMVPFPLNGRPTAFFRGDWFVGKGVACAKIRYGDGERDVVEVLNTHTHPAYSKSTNEDSGYIVHRLSQAWETAKLVRGACERGHLVVALGDFNNVPLSLPYRVFSAHAPVRDAWRVLYPDSSLGSSQHDLERARRRPVPTASFNVVENGVTSQSRYNTWAWTKSERRTLRKEGGSTPVPPDEPDERGKRIDYIFFSSGRDPRSKWQSDEPPGPHDQEAGPRGVPGWVVKDVRVGAMGRHPTLGCSLSDHFSVEATLLLHTPSPPKHNPERHHHHLHHPTRHVPSAARMSRGAIAAAAAAAATGTRATPTPGGVEFDARSVQSRASASSSSSSAAATSATTEAAAAAAVEQGAYLQSPTASEHRSSNDSRDLDRASEWDAQLAAFDGSVHDGLPGAAYDEVLSLAADCARRARRRRRRGLAHLAAWLAVAAALWVAVWFVVVPVAFVFLVVLPLGLVAGAVDGLGVALLFCSRELRALAEFDWEVRNARALASGAPAGGLARDDEDEKSW
ncbi:Endonuclease/exonuclease/phosphatase [Xylariaceae sp. FL0804]|nr:Endonuclease/exonuclease/phosphatase [Xylariaceae sp. FL0804]